MIRKERWITKHGQFSKEEKTLSVDDDGRVSLCISLTRLIKGNLFSSRRAK
jgi:hypothetical protein